MATHEDFVASVCSRSGLGSALSYRKMFGEYALYLHDRVVALACDNQLFLKPTDAGRALLGAVDEAAPYPGAKPHFRLDDALDDPALLKKALEVTAQSVAPPKPKRAGDRKPAKKTPSKRRAT